MAEGAPEDTAGRGRLLEGFVPHLSECVHRIDQRNLRREPPFTPRGCIAQAWSVAEVLRARMKLDTVALPPPLVSADGERR